MASCIRFVGMTIPVFSGRREGNGGGTGLVFSSGAQPDLSMGGWFDSGSSRCDS